MTARDEQWFTRLFDAHAVAVHRFVARRADRSDVEDLTADVLTVAWRRRADIPAGAELPWLYRTAGFVVANHHRKARPTPLAVVPDDGDPETPQWSDGGDDLRRVMADLSPRDQRILLLSAWDGLSGDDLAAVLEISRGGAAAALSRARTRLQQAWDRVDAAG
ncbi:sigma-70 family RNA polymerase sigma factor [Nakamurella flavida]|uniref:Sigma-70 family RNA polymerase sigma factor n=1 Tax=Nakamurella flavida TaxID=363630 RepID=A0A939C3F4_9ACTN|nr:sigma-70 family RNA polymerase sigma factor [Nakamurella flavida]MBM9477585.1 sigma-70 family RNA polymerase sigma factor [Nakamurella flavida]MDP9779133.1 RNA polymerase sigma-70 factor (ECF subfamily) [Nakamurella flavida]